MTTRAQKAAAEKKSMAPPVESPKIQAKGRKKKTADELDGDFDITKVTEKITVEDMDVDHQPKSNLDTIANKIFNDQLGGEPKKKKSPPPKSPKAPKSPATNAAPPSVNPGDPWGPGESALLVCLAVGSDSLDFRAHGGIRGV
jgi:hypothetical protein